VRSSESTRADGTTYFRARIRLADGSRVRVDVPAKHSTPAGGKTARERATLYAEALQEDEDENGTLLAEKRAAAPSASRSAPGAEVSTTWFARYVEVHTSLGNGTKQHKGDWRNYVEPTIGTKALTAVTPDDIKTIRDKLSRARLEGKISAHRAMNIWSTVVKAPLSRAFTDDDPKCVSVRVGPFAANPAAGIKPPVTKADRDQDERERQALDVREAAALLSCSSIPIDTRRFYAWANVLGAPARRALRPNVGRRSRGRDQGAARPGHEERRGRHNEDEGICPRRADPSAPHASRDRDAREGARVPRRAGEGR
jgi:hypothetical protein